MVDGTGALVSAVALGLILPAFQAFIGMPMGTLYLLAGLAIGFAVYSLSCAFTRRTDPKWLWAIMLVNLSYCVLTVSLVIYHRESMTIWGISYFVGEIAIILGLVYWESKYERGA